MSKHEIQIGPLAVVVEVDTYAGLPLVKYHLAGEPIDRADLECVVRLVQSQAVVNALVEIDMRLQAIALCLDPLEVAKHG